MFGCRKVEVNFIEIKVSTFQAVQVHNLLSWLEMSISAQKHNSRFHRGTCEPASPADHSAETCSLQRTWQWKSIFFQQKRNLETFIFHCCYSAKKNQRIKSLLLILLMRKRNQNMPTPNNQSNQQFLTRLNNELIELAVNTSSNFASDVIFSTRSPCRSGRTLMFEENFQLRIQLTTTHVS